MKRMAHKMNTLSFIYEKITSTLIFKMHTHFSIRKQKVFTCLPNGQSLSSCICKLTSTFNKKYFQLVINLHTRQVLGCKILTQNCVYNVAI